LRIVSDAELIQKGAEVDENGNLKVSENEQDKLKIEHEKCDLETYIRLKKTIAVDVGEISELKKEISTYAEKFNNRDIEVMQKVLDMMEKRETGTYSRGDELFSWNETSMPIAFIDSSGNLCAVLIKYKEILGTCDRHTIFYQLKDLNFSQNAETSISQGYNCLLRLKSRIAYAKAKKERQINV
jgi:hypothetical protein